MGKLLEYVAVAAVTLVLFLGAATFFGIAHRDGLRSDCERMGQHRYADLHITCAVVREKAAP